MYSTLKSLLLTCAVVSMATGASAQNRAFDPPAARTSQAGGGALTAPNASPRAALAEYLRARGRSQATADSLVEGTRNAARQGILHVQFTQRAGGLEVFG